MKENMKDIYFIRQYVFSFKMNANRLKECYNIFIELGEICYNAQKLQTMLDNINCLDDQVKSCLHTSRKDHKYNILGACKYLVSEVACIFPDKYP